jgi:hypothetical protein
MGFHHSHEATPSRGSASRLRANQFFPLPRLSNLVSGQHPRIHLHPGGLLDPQRHLFPKPGPCRSATWAKQAGRRLAPGRRRPWHFPRAAACVGFSDNYPPRAENRTSRKSEAQMSAFQSPTRAILVPSPSSLVPVFPVSSPPPPGPPPCGNLFSAPSLRVTNAVSTACILVMLTNQ